MSISKQEAFIGLSDEGHSKDEIAIIKKIQKLTIRARLAAEGSFSGKYRSHLKGNGMVFEEVKEYSFGDEVKNIDWNVTARMNQPYSKRFVEERELSFIILLDVSGSQEFGSGQSKKDYCLEVAAMLAFSAVKNADRAGLLLFSDEVECYLPPAKGVRQVLHMLRTVLRHKSRSQKTDIQVALNFMNKIKPSRGIICLVSDFLYPANFSIPLSLMAKQHKVIALAVNEAKELQLPKLGLMCFSDIESEQTMLVDTSSVEFKEQYAKNVQRHKKELSQFFVGLNIPLLFLDTHDDYSKKLNVFFKKL